MKTDALLLRAVGRADGFVFGALTPQGGIDIQACKDILQVTAPLPVTFHRAIDVCDDALGAVQIIAELGASFCLIQIYYRIQFALLCKG